MSMPWLSDIRYIIADQRQTDVEQLALMSHCALGGIVPNSTFGWWGAWMGWRRGTHPHARYTMPASWLRVGESSAALVFDREKVVVI